MLKATVSAMWALDVFRLTLRFPTAQQFFNNPSMSFLQLDVLAYAALKAYYPLLLFLAFGRYGFIPEVYNAPALFPHDSLDAAKIDHLAETIIRQNRPPCRDNHCRFSQCRIVRCFTPQLRRSSISHYIAIRPPRDHVRQSSFRL
uniref:Uncharacterized protein n=1 Tax=Romanomermis culicivorax TaxID=13658 RepID=A0A915IWR1_ROMCU